MLFEFVCWVERYFFYFISASFKHFFFLTLTQCPSEKSCIFFLLIFLHFLLIFLFFSHRSQLNLNRRARDEPHKNDVEKIIKVVQYKNDRWERIKKKNQPEQRNFWIFLSFFDTFTTTPSSFHDLRLKIHSHNVE